MDTCRRDGRRQVVQRKKLNWSPGREAQATQPLARPLYPTSLRPWVPATRGHDLKQGSSAAEESATCSHCWAARPPGKGDLGRTCLCLLHSESPLLTPFLSPDLTTGLKRFEAFPSMFLYYKSPQSYNPPDCLVCLSHTKRCYDVWVPDAYTWMLHMYTIICIYFILQLPFKINSLCKRFIYADACSSNLIHFHWYKNSHCVSMLWFISFIPFSLSGFCSKKQSFSGHLPPWTPILRFL